MKPAVKVNEPTSLLDVWIKTKREKGERERKKRKRNEKSKLTGLISLPKERSASEKKKVVTVSPVSSHCINQASPSADTLPDKGH